MKHKKNNEQNETKCHFFDIEDAAKYGVVEAVILSNIKHWIEFNKVNQKNFHDNRYWTYNSVENFRAIFPYLSARQISYALQKLETEGAVMVGRYNKKKYDKTKWYSIPDETDLQICQTVSQTDLQNCQMHLTKVSNLYQI